MEMNTQSLDVSSVINGKEYIVTEERCPKKGHEKYQIVIVDGDMYCPKCRVETMNAGFSEKHYREIIEQKKRGNQKYLYRHSIVNSDLALGNGIKNFVCKTDADTEIKNKSIAIVKALSEENQNVFIYGKAGTGKSHIAMGILNNVNALSEDRRCLFVSVPKLYELIRESYNSKYSDVMTESDYLKIITDADVLVLDDLGAELSINTNKQASDFVSRILYSILDARENKTTIFTSNHSITELATILDEKIVSRIKRDITYIGFDGLTDKRPIAKKLKKEAEKGE